MRRSLLVVLALFAVAVVAADPPEVKEKDKDNKAPVEKPRKASLTVGNDLPGVIHPYNVTGPRKGHFSCPVSANGLHPGVLILVRGEPDAESAPLKELLQKLDNAIEKNPNVRLGICMVFIPDDLKDVLAEDDKRGEAATKVDDLAKATMLKHVVLALTHKEDLEAYGIQEKEGYIVVAYHKYQIRGMESLEKDKLTPEKVQSILTMLGEKLGATKK
jgi:hypothetical protein